MTETLTRIGMSLEDFIRKFDQDGPFEILDGEIVPKMPNVFGHTTTANRIAFAINVFTIPQKLGEAFVEGTVIKPDSFDRNWVKGSRIPDVLYVSQERLNEYKDANPDWESRPLALIPDLVIEVVSPTDSYTETNKRVKRYLDDGVRLVWVMDPQERTIVIYVPNSAHQSTLSGEATLTGGEVIPGFEIALAEIFGG
jgi:Uma2 family endonuclease